MNAAPLFRYCRAPALALLCLCAGAVGAAPVSQAPERWINALAQAEPDAAGLRAPLAEDAGRSRIAPSEAARRVTREHGGKVLNVVLVEDGVQAPYYRVKLLDAGRVRVVHVDAFN